MSASVPQRIAIQNHAGRNSGNSGKESTMSEPRTEDAMPRHGRVVYTARVHTTGGRDGQSRSSDGRLDVKLSTPGSARIGTNPEQLFAAGWSACFESAIAQAAHYMKITLPPDIAVDAEVDLKVGDWGYFLSAHLDVSMPGVATELAHALVDEANRICPYSKATRGNIDLTITLV